MKLVATTLSIAMLLVMTTSVRAAPIISGQFTLDGTVTATANTIVWTSNGGTANQATIPMDLSCTNNTGSFCALGGTTVMIQPLNRATEPVGGTFAAQTFFSFLGAPTFPTLNVTSIPLGVFDPAGCAASPPAVGQTCTPSVPGAPSPFSFVNTATGSSATWNALGVTSDGNENWSAIFTVQFVGRTFQDVLNQFNTTGSVSNAYSANVQLTVTPTVPEPRTELLTGLGLALVSLSFLRSSKARRTRDQ
jgi:hypothetical protein